MKLFLIRMALVAAVVIAAHYLILITVHSPLPSEYWLREFVIAKKHQAEAMPSPKLIFSGGSSTLFGIDAAKMQKELGHPAINLGLHASMRLEDHLQLAREVAKPGDTVILSLEPAYYDLYSTTWTTWALRNALAWNRESLDRLPLPRRLQLYATSSDPTITSDLAQAAFDEKFFPRTVAPRLQALQPPQEVIARYEATMATSHEFGYQLSNLDANGDILNAKSGEPPFTGDAWPLVRPDHISSYAQGELKPFLAEMKTKGVRVLFNYTPYLCRGEPDAKWMSADNSFREDLARLGGDIIGKRDDQFFPISAFYHSNLHLNEDGRRDRTAKLIEALRPRL